MQKFFHREVDISIEKIKGSFFFDDLYTLKLKRKSNAIAISITKQQAEIIIDEFNLKFEKL